ncbi:MAG TPA: alpha/beta hydrolase [Anaerolineae bacterium]|nr:alpha/beta hydrolase [Anaerolineae bacterium]
MISFNRFKQLLFFLIILRLTAQLGLHATVADAYTRPANHAFTTPIPAGYQTAQFTSADGIQLHGWYHPPQNDMVIILLHGYGANRTEMLGRAAMLTQHQFGVLLYDLRGHGYSLAPQRSYGWQDTADVTAAIDYLQNLSNPPAKIGLFGFSMGGQIALRSALEHDEIAAIVVDGPAGANLADVPPSSVGGWLKQFDGWLGLQILEWYIGQSAPPAIISQIKAIAPRPILFIGVDNELPTAAWYYEHAAEGKTLWQIPDSHHGQAPQTHPREYEQKLITFFQH